MSFDDGNYNDAQSFPCDCGECGNITRDKDSLGNIWTCDKCSKFYDEDSKEKV